MFEYISKYMLTKDPVLLFYSIIVRTMLQIAEGTELITPPLPCTEQHSVFYNTMK